MNRFPIGRGLSWMTMSIMIYRGAFLRLLLIGLVLQFLTGATQSGPLGFLFVLAVPALTAGVLQAVHGASMGIRPTLMTLFSAFSDPTRLMRLFILGLVLLAAAVLAAGGMLSGSIAELDPALLARLEQGDMTALNDAGPDVIQRMLLSLVTGLMASALIGFFAIPLIWFRDSTVGTAILYGLSAIFKNILPLLFLLLLLGLMAMPVLLVASLLLSSGSGSNILTLLLLLLVAAYQLLVFITQYVTFREIFGIQLAPDDKSDGDDQLVA